MTTGEERWQPDDGLIYAVQHRPVPIADLSGPDRAWIVAYLTAQGWTVASIAERLRCSLRLVQQIKAEPMTRVATLAQSLIQQLDAQRCLQHMEGVSLLADLAAAQARIAALERHRDVLLHRLLEGNRRYEVSDLSGSPRTAARRGDHPSPVRLGECG